MTQPAPHNIQVEIVLVNGLKFDFNVTIDNASDDIGFVAWCKSVKADGMFISSVMTIPWHAIGLIQRRQAVAQQVALAQATPAEGAKPN